MDAIRTTDQGASDLYDFDTRNFPNDTKVAKCQRFLSDFWGDSSVVASSRSKFDVALQSKPFGRLGLVKILYKNLKFVRRKGVSKLFSCPFYVVSFCESGHANLSSRNGQILNRPNQVLFAKFTEGNSMAVDDEYVATRLLIPASVMNAYIPNSPNAMLLHEGATSMKTELLKNMMALLLKKGNDCSEGPETVKTLEKHMLELLALTVEVQESAPISDETSICFAHRLRVQRVIQDNLDNPDLKPALIAKLSQLSERYLYRIFNGSDLSLMQTVTKIRLEKAQELLRADCLPKQTIGQIAYNCGFSTHPAFCRAFLAHFGVSPKEYRTLQSENN